MTTARADNRLQAGPPRAAANGNPVDVDYRYAAASDLDAALLRPRDEWLSARERRELAAWRNPGRGAAWLRGRWLAKHSVAAGLRDKPPLPAIEILSLDTAGQSTRPDVSCDGAKVPWSLSISHTEGGVLVAWCDRSAVSVGADLVVPGDVTDPVVRRWFTAGEREWARRGGRLAASFIWAAKEAIYKARNRGESFAPRQIEVSSPQEATYRGTPLGNLNLHRFHLDDHLAVVAVVGIDSDSSLW